MIAIVDYNVGNLYSVTGALKHLGYESKVTGDKKELEKADAIILPGVGAFPDAMRELKNHGIIDFLKEQALKKPFLGICLGMQMLFDQSEEFGITEGLHLISGNVLKIPSAPGLKIPHMGWNSLEITKDTPILKGFTGGEYVYFVHSYHAVLSNKDNLTSVTDYGGKITAAVQNGYVFGTQFHPEKSGEVGLMILKNFGELSK
ncbi:MAG: imidazole glycerol phosphate synthase subunit HisH [Bacillota bacterium]|nr:imidazole glycerol phosphate synthase subunit HisH [Bacillota bacterium]